MSEVKKVIAVEEHFMSPTVNRKYNEIFRRTETDPARLAKAGFIDRFAAVGEITEVGEERLRFMDEHGIDVQILSYGNNSPMYLEAEDAVPLCRQVNEELAEYCKAYPGRFYGFATLPAADPEAAVQELEYSVQELGLCGVMFNGNYQGHFFDESRFYPVFEKAAELQVPVMFHPGEVAAQVSKYYYQGGVAPFRHQHLCRSRNRMTL